MSALRRWLREARSDLIARRAQLRMCLECGGWEERRTETTDGVPVVIRQPCVTGRCWGCRFAENYRNAMRDDPKVYAAYMTGV